MFIIPCKYSEKHNYIISLVENIRKFHLDEEIVVVDSNSDDKSYFKEIEKYNVIIEDIGNKNYHAGAYWYCFEKYNRDFYYFMHDSMIVNQNLDYLKNKELTVFAYFEYDPIGDIAEYYIKKFTNYNIPKTGYCAFGPIFFCKRIVMEKLYNSGISKILSTYNEHNKNQPSEGLPAHYQEAVFGLAFNQEGYDFQTKTMIGNIIHFMRNNCGGLYINIVNKTEYPIVKIFAKRG